MLILTSYISVGFKQRIDKEILNSDRCVQMPNTGKCVLVCGSCIPLYNFDYIYNYVMSSRKSFVDR